jgi:hypothetical protein
MIMGVADGAGPRTLQAKASLTSKPPSLEIPTVIISVFVIAVSID